MILIALCAALLALEEWDERRQARKRAQQEADEAAALRREYR
jgi:hypothetical protein